MQITEFYGQYVFNRYFDSDVLSICRVNLKDDKIESSKRSFRVSTKCNIENRRKVPT